MKEIIQIFGGLISITMLVGSTPANQKTYQSVTHFSGRLSATQIIEVYKTKNRDAQIKLVSNLSQDSVVSITKQYRSNIFIANSVMWIGPDYSIDLDSGTAIQY